MRSIDADKLLENIAKIVSAGGMDPTEKIGRIIIAVTESPALDAVEVVRCKDCTTGSWDVLAGCYWCNGIPKSHDGFCNRGERRKPDA